MNRSRIALVVVGLEVLVLTAVVWGQDRPATPAKATAPATRPGAAAPVEPPEHLTAGQIQTVVEILQAQDPALAARLQEALERQPDQVRKLITAQWPRLAKLVELKSRDPRVFQLTVEEIRLNRATRDLAGRIRAAAGDPKLAGQLKAELRQRVAEHFAKRQELRQQELENLRQKMQDMAGAIQKRETDKDALIQMRSEELIANKVRPQPLHSGEF